MTQKRTFFSRVADFFLFIPRQINRKLKIKITYKTTFLYALVYIVIAAAISLFASLSVDNSIKTRSAAWALDQIDVAADYLEDNGIDKAADIYTLTHGDILILKGGAVVFQSAEININGVSLGVNGFVYEDKHITVCSVEQIGGESYTIYLHTNISSQLQTRDLLVAIFCFTSPIGLIILVALGSLASAGMLNPIKKINDGIKSITAESLETRISSVNSQDELNELIFLLNNMLTSLENSFTEQARFVSDASHELRTPIAVVQGYASLLERWGKTDPSVLDEAITAISKESENMKNLVDKLLFLAKTETLNVKPEHFVLAELIEEVARETSLTALGKLKQIDIIRLEPVEVNADRELIKQALRVFVDNAVKYTGDNGVIRLSCYAEGSFAVLKVKDNGIGIKEADMPYIFERFYRCDQSRNRDIGSSGLGLSIAKWIVDTHDGEIVLRSTEGAGTEVYVKIPKLEK